LDKLEEKRLNYPDWGRTLPARGPYELFKGLTGIFLSTHASFEVAKNLRVLDVSPSKEDIAKEMSKIAEVKS
jgi:hypothetical protein